MSDTGRQSFTDKAGSAMKPDSQKGTMEQTGDYVKGKMDSAASMMQSDSNKSMSQKMGDSMTGDSNALLNDPQESLMDKAKNAMGMGKDESK
ncbi:hypothetical protein AMATHDRAFT_135718 [Amanita thiersii Skay4041]|uniref:Heat shock protein 9/12 n=1 Tax=Amanita thiersii Skay4041 TaxID=703135 RepID=A0A2A9NVR4_9AGAR|nr:hypothetical protein AMATHDRAFT_135718 [Amanita thiersii Skay4041]